MKQTNINSFSHILLDDLEHVVFNTPAYGSETFIPTCREPIQLNNFRFTKKYNLIYQNESMESGCDIKAPILLKKYFPRTKINFL